MTFTVLFFSVTFNSPANYSPAIRFDKTLTYSTVPSDPTGSDPTANPSSVASGPAISDTVPTTHRDYIRPLPSVDTSYRDIRADTSRYLTIRLRYGRSADTPDYAISKDTMAAEISYKATDSIVMKVHSQQITLYSKAESNYQDAKLTADRILFDQSRNLVIASPSHDSAGVVKGLPKLVQGDNTMTSDTITYNIKSQKAITQHTYTVSGQMFVHVDKMKKITPEEYFGYRGVFTTCNLDTPHFAFRTNKMKIINQKMAITGPIHPEFEGVPIPIYLPFGFFPLTQGRHSGLLPPEFTSSDQAGLGLTGLGYYRVVSDNFDVIFRTDLYSYGGWAVYLTPEYKVRYRYSGQVNFTMQNTKLLASSGADAFQQTRTFSFNWAHTMDQKARPGTNFSANVNVASTKFAASQLNNPTAAYNNQLSSSITYSHTFAQKYNLTMSANHNQNNETRLINVSLPNLSFTAPVTYPLQAKTFVGTPKWYEKLGIGLTTTVAGNASFYDSLFTLKRAIDTFQWGAQNAIPITLALPIKGPVTVTPGVSLSERVYSRKMFRHYDAGRNKVDTDAIAKGIFQEESMSYSLSLASAIFGTFQGFGRNSTLMGIRHVIRPTIALTYTPNFAGKDWYTIRTPYDTGDVTKFTPTRRVSYYDGTVYGPFSEGTFGGISFGLDNHFEIKTRSKTDTSSAGIKKTTIIDGVGFTGSYNYLADSFKLSNISLYFRSTLFKNINITGGATIDPYQHNAHGTDVDKYAWEGKSFSVGRITTGNLAISTSFKSAPIDQKLEDQKKAAQGSDQLPMTIEEQQAQLNYIRQNPGQFADFNIQWSLNLSFALNFTNQLQTNYSYKTTITSSINWSGDFNLTSNWKVGLTGFYDVKAGDMQSLTASISRNLHCWQMSINVTPVGYTHFFSFTISPKSGILQDLKINRTKYFYNE
ncbi:MAG TPA: putative LPS assembly protein LptD [Puia sp.]|nr:putative LPS assembly protein LptD [Puia sp.]